VEAKGERPLKRGERWGSQHRDRVAVLGKPDLGVERGGVSCREKLLSPGRITARS
jgi:hypothetical protein